MYVSDGSYDLTREQAELVRRFRCLDACTWRMVAVRAAEAWPEKEICSDNQFDGMWLCNEAAKLLGEHPREDPWN